MADAPDANASPSKRVLDYFNARLICHLGGRVNQHWLIDNGSETLVLRQWHKDIDRDSIEWEVRLLERLSATRLPGPRVVAGPAQIEGTTWSLAPYLAGEATKSHGTANDQRARGRLLAEFHAATSTIDVSQRPGWRRCENALADDALDIILAKSEADRPEEARIIRWHLDRARERITRMSLADRPSILIHGDFTSWNLLFAGGRLTGILDFELSRLDHRVADFSLSWRGKYDDVIHGYNEVSHLEPEEWEALTTVWWALLIDLACCDLKYGVEGDLWAVRQLLRRSPLMGMDAEPYSD